MTGRIVEKAKFNTELLENVVAGEPKEFAYQIGISESALYNYLRGDRIPLAEVLYRIAKHTGHTMEDFFVETPAAHRKQAVNQ